MRSDFSTHFSRTRPLVTAAVFFGAGIFVGMRNAFSWQYAVALVLSVILLFTKRRFLATWALMFFLGVTIMSIAANPVRPDAGEYHISGIVAGDVVVRETGQVHCTLKNVLLDGQATHTAGYWSYYLKKDETAVDFCDGDRVTFTGRLYHPMKRSNPHGFDFNQYLLQNGMTLGLYGRDGLTIEKHAANGIDHLAYRLRQMLSERLVAAMGEAAGPAIAMTLGDKSLMPDEDREAFRNLGIAHLLSISGLHVGYVVMLLGALFKLFNVSKNVRLPVMALVLTAYALITGLSASVIRASILTLILLTAKHTRRPNDTLTALAISAMIILLFRPMALTSPGFILSYMAVGGITLLYRPLKKGLRFLPDKLGNALAVSIAAQIGVILPQTAYYQSAGLLSMLVNPLMIPVAGVLVMLYFITMAFPFMGVVATFATRLFTFVTTRLAKIPFMTLATAAPPWYIWCGVILVAVLISPYTRLKQRTRVSLCTAALLLMLSTLWIQAPPSYTVFASGQADCAVLETDGYTMVVDVGENASDLASYLRAKNKAIDALVLTHLHNDHVQGLEQLIAREVKIKALYVPYGYERFDWDEGCLALVRSLGLPLNVLKAGDELPYTKVIWPVAQHLPPFKEANSLSVGLVITLEGVRILTQGDMAAGYERLTAEPADVLKVSHHGSAGATSEAFLQDTEPTVSVITCKSFAALPSEMLLDRLLNTAVYRTDETGAVKITPMAGSFTVETFLP